MKNEYLYVRKLGINYIHANFQNISVFKASHGTA